MKLLWTRNPKPATSRPAPQEPPDDEEDYAPRRPPAIAIPEALRRVPFDPGACILLEPPAESERLAFSAHLRAHRTRAAFWHHAPAADWMLDVLRQSWHVVPVAPDAALRAFALQCVAGLPGADFPGAGDLKAAVQRRITGPVRWYELEALQAKTKPFVASAGADGLPRCSPLAAGQLALWHTADPNPYEAAFWAAEFAALHEAFTTLARAAESWTAPSAIPPEWRAAFYSHHHPDVRTRAMRAASERQAVLLKTRLPQPFIAEAAGPWRWS